MIKKIDPQMERYSHAAAINDSLVALNVASPRKLVIDKDSDGWKVGTGSHYEIDIDIVGVTSDDVFTEIITNTSHTITAHDGYITINTGSGTAPQSDVTICIIKTTSIA